MNRLRFGALLVDDEDHLGFYLSHRMVLTVLERGPVRAMSMKDFRPSAVFTVGAVAVASSTGWRRRWKAGRFLKIHWKW